MCCITARAGTQESSSGDRKQFLSKITNTYVLVSLMFKNFSVIASKLGIAQTSEYWENC